MPDPRDFLRKDKVYVKSYARNKRGSGSGGSKDNVTPGCIIVAIVAIILVATYVIPPVTKWVGENIVLIGVVLAIIVIVGIVALYKRIKNK